MPSETDRNYVTILGTRVDSTPEDQLLTYVGKKLEKKTKFSLFTPNPEIILHAFKDPKLAGIINKADFSVPDGVGLKLAHNSLPVIHGRKFMLKVLDLANARKLKAFFITSNELATNNKLLDKLHLEYPDIQAKSVIGHKVDMQANPVSEVDIAIEKDIVNQINTFKPDLLFVCFGASKQEKWIARMLPTLNVYGALGIGGALDYYAGSKKLPPKLFEKLELEWLWRLFIEKGHLPRVFNAVVVFPLLVAFERLKLVK